MTIDDTVNEVRSLTGTTIGDGTKVTNTEAAAATVASRVEHEADVLGEQARINLADTLRAIDTAATGNEHVTLAAARGVQNTVVGAAVAEMYNTSLESATTRDHVTHETNREIINNGINGAIQGDLTRKHITRDGNLTRGTVIGTSVALAALGTLGLSNLKASLPKPTPIVQNMTNPTQDPNFDFSQYSKSPTPAAEEFSASGKTFDIVPTGTYTVKTPITDAVSGDGATKVIFEAAPNTSPSGNIVINRQPRGIVEAAFTPHELTTNNVILGGTRLDVIPNGIGAKNGEKAFTVSTNTGNVDQLDLVTPGGATIKSFSATPQGLEDLAQTAIYTNPNPPDNGNAASLGQIQQRLGLQIPGHAKVGSGKTK